MMHIYKLPQTKLQITSYNDYIITEFKDFFFGDKVDHKFCDIMAHYTTLYDHNNVDHTCYKTPHK